MKSMKRMSNSDKVFVVIDYSILALLVIIVLYPLLYVVMASVAKGPQSMTLYLIPKEFSLAGYKAVAEHKDIWTGYINSLINVALGVMISLTVTMLCAYPLSRPEFKARRFVMALCIFTMYFGGGLIPNFLLINSLGLLKTRLALLLPGAMSVYNMIVIRSYIMTSIPNEIRESARIDGCGNARYLISMVLPLSRPILAVIGLFTAVGIWNSYFDAMIYLPGKRELFPLALILREILVLNVSVENFIDVEEMRRVAERADVMKYALIIVSTVPVLLIYPFVQKHFVKGVMIGSVKG